MGDTSVHYGENSATEGLLFPALGVYPTLSVSVCESVCKRVRREWGGEGGERRGRLICIFIFVHIHADVDKGDSRNLIFFSILRDSSRFSPIRKRAEVTANLHTHLHVNSHNLVDFN